MISQRRTLLIMLLLYSLYVIYEIAQTHRHGNVFSTLRIGLTESTHGIRARLTRNNELNLLKANEELVHKLESPLARSAYLRFGHLAFVECEYCSSMEDYLVFLAGQNLKEYIAACFLMGLLTMGGGGRERLRARSLVLLACLSVAEAFYISTWQLSDLENQTAFSLHDRALLIRRFAFLLLPWVIVCATSRRREDGLLTLVEPLALGVQALNDRALRARLVSEAVLRNPTLRAASSRWWSECDLDSKSAFVDAELTDLANRLGMDLEGDGAIRGRAKSFVKSTFDQSAKRG